MVPASAALDAFVNANILLIFSYGLWLIVRAALSQTRLRHAYSSQLLSLNAIFVTIALSPFVILAFGLLQTRGLSPAVNVNLSDLVVAYYLNGGFEMEATTVERLLVWREGFTTDVVNMAGWAAIGVTALFAVGVAISSLRLIISVFCLWRILSNSYSWRRFGRIRIRLSDQVLVPFSTRGLRNYYVVIPSHMLAQSKELKVSLAHEFQHLRQGDIEWEILLEALKPLFFLNPAYHAWKRQVEQLRELSCDARVLARGHIDLRSYCDTLLSVCQHALRKDRDFVLALPKVTLVTADRVSPRNGRLSRLEERIVGVLTARKIRNQNLVSVAIMVPLIAAILLTTVAIQKPGDWSQDRLMLSTVVNLERLDKINELSTFGRVRD